MKTLIYQTLTTDGIPGGEGSTALPISFINVIVRRRAERSECQRAKTKRGAEAAKRPRKREIASLTCPGGRCQGVSLAMTLER